MFVDGSNLAFLRKWRSHRCRHGLPEDAELFTAAAFAVLTMSVASAGVGRGASKCISKE
jgi:hypothetical protein